jgi:hypothetical protein
LVASRVGTRVRVLVGRHAWTDEDSLVGRLRQWRRRNAQCDAARPARGGWSRWKAASIQSASRPRRMGARPAPRLARFSFPSGAMMREPPVQRCEPCHSLGKAPASRRRPTSRSISSSAQGISEDARHSHSHTHKAERIPPPWRLSFFSSPFAVRKEVRDQARGASITDAA